MRRLTCALLMLLTVAVRAQTLTGMVRDAATLASIPGATVFLNNTAYQTETDSAGRFVLTRIPTGTYTLVVRLLGYRASAQPVTVAGGKLPHLRIDLTPDPAQLAEVHVRAGKDREWAGQLQRFTTQFLGNGPAAESCKLTNPWLLTFTDRNGVLTARADDALEIDNQFLGYKIRYLLRSFRFDGAQVVYTGYAQFTPYLTTDRQQRETWEANRQYAWQQSDIHFFDALRNRRAPADGYEAFVDKPGEDPTKRSPYFFQDQRKRLQPVVFDSLVSGDKAGGVYRLSVPHRLEIHHLNSRGDTPLYKDKPVDVAWIETNGRPLRFNRDGVILNPDDCVLSGYLVNQRVAGMLPLDFRAAGQSNPFLLPVDITRHRGTATPFFTTDRPWYTSRDRVRVSGFLTDTDPDALSSVLHLELVNPGNRVVVAHQRVRVHNARFSTELILNDSLRTPTHFLLRAYTNPRPPGDSSYAFRWLPVLPPGQRFRPRPLTDSVLADRFMLSRDDTVLTVTPTARFADALRWASLTVLDADRAGFSGPMSSIATHTLADTAVVPVERGVDVRGRITKPRQTGGSVSLFSPGQQLMFFADVDSLGGFAFRDLPLMGSQPVLLTATDVRGKPVRKPVVAFDSLPGPTWLPPLPPAIDNRLLEADTTTHQVPDGILLREVAVKARTPPKPPASLYKNADYTLQGQDLFDKAVGTNILTALQGRVPGINIVEFPDESGFMKLTITMRGGGSARGLSGGKPPQPLVLVDGVPFDDVNQLSVLPASLVERIEVVKRAESLLGLRGYVGVISIITKRAAGVPLLTDPPEANFIRHTLTGLAPDLSTDSRTPTTWDTLSPDHPVAHLRLSSPPTPMVLVIEGMTKTGTHFRLSQAVER